MPRCLVKVGNNYVKRAEISSDLKITFCKNSHSACEYTERQAVDIAEALGGIVINLSLDDGVITQHYYNSIG